MQLNFSVPFNTPRPTPQAEVLAERDGEVREKRKRPVAAVSRKLVLGETPCSAGAAGIV